VPTLLAIEDERKVLRALERGLQNEGYQGIAAANGDTSFQLGSRLVDTSGLARITII
jgi:DNA-binding response OmpR family regulator